jgi:hypothetical protein
VVTPAPVVGGGQASLAALVCFVALLHIDVKTHASRACATVPRGLVAGWALQVAGSSGLKVLLLRLCYLVAIALVFSCHFACVIKLSLHWYEVFITLVLPLH